MIRLKVIHASHLLLGVSIALLVIVLAVLLISSNARHTQATAPTAASTEYAHEAVAAFAAAVSAQGQQNGGQVPIDWSAEMQIEVLPASPAPDPSPTPNVPRVLIYHTHTHEAYQQVSEDPYEETETWRTDDPQHSVVRVGEELAGQLRALGVEVIHDTTDHEPPKLGTAYTRSLETLKSYKTQHFDCYIDLHRDAYDESVYQTLSASVGGQSVAQLMVLIGNGEGFNEKPKYEQNLSFAQALTDQLNALSSNICRDVLVKNGRYNQHVGCPAILIEVGHNMNTLKEAVNAMPYLARALNALLQGEQPVPLSTPKVVPVIGG